MTFPTEQEAREFLAGMTDVDKDRIVVIPTTHGYWTFTGKEEAAQPAKLCSICGEPFQEFTNNARPVNGGRCCAYCDEHVVTPARLARGRG